MKLLASVTLIGQKQKKPSQTSLRRKEELTAVRHASQKILDYKKYNITLQNQKVAQLRLSKNSSTILKATNVLLLYALFASLTLFGMWSGKTKS